VICSPNGFVTLSDSVSNSRPTSGDDQLSDVLWGLARSGGSDLKIGEFPLLYVSLNRILVETCGLTLCPEALLGRV